MSQPGHELLTAYNAHVQALFDTTILVAHSRLMHLFSEIVLRYFEQQDSTALYRAPLLEEQGKRFAVSAWQTGCVMRCTAPLRRIEDAVNVTILQHLLDGQPDPIPTEVLTEITGWLNEDQSHDKDYAVKRQRIGQIFSGSERALQRPIRVIRQVVEENLVDLLNWKERQLLIQGFCNKNYCAQFWLDIRREFGWPAPYRVILPAYTQTGFTLIGFLVLRIGEGTYCSRIHVARTEESLLGSLRFNLIATVLGRGGLGAQTFQERLTEWFNERDQRSPKEALGILCQQLGLTEPAYTTLATGDQSLGWASTVAVSQNGTRYETALVHATKRTAAEHDAAAVLFDRLEPLIRTAYLQVLHRSRPIQTYAGLCRYLAIDKRFLSSDMEAVRAIEEIAYLLHSAEL